MCNSQFRKSCSFRDPAGFVFERDGSVYRQIQTVAQDDYECLMSSGLFQNLIDHRMMLRHEEGEFAPFDSDMAWKVIRLEKVPYISYPYEWCFEQYKQAALLTLDVHIAALQRGMILKDASAYNVQFVGSRAVFIDTLSFAVYKDGQGWDGYGQYCRHFLAPLLLMAAKDLQLGRLMELYIDGIPLDVATRILSGKWRYKFGVFIHLYLHARQISRTSSLNRKIQTRLISKGSLIAIAKSLRKTIAGIRPYDKKTEWGEYYDKMLNYTDEAFAFKYNTVQRFVADSGAGIICDMGANRGEFTKAALEGGADYCVAFDIDSTAVNRNYAQLASKGELRVLPLQLDLTSPSPAIGWANSERESVLGRGRFDCMLSLALIHHLAIANNIPLEKIATHFADLCRYLVIEFVPKTDSQVQKLLLNRLDIFPTYDEPHFEAAFLKYFNIEEKCTISGSQRTLYHMKSKMDNI